MKRYTFRYNATELDLSVQMIEKAIGYGTGESPEPVSELIGEVIAEVNDICDIRAEYTQFGTIVAKTVEGELLIASKVFKTGNIILSQMKKAVGVAIFLCTAGQLISDLSTRHMKKGDLLKGYIYDVIGSAIVEAAADRMQASLRKELSTGGIGISNRFSPGYCGWNVSEQHKLFSLIPDNFCGITLTDSALMQPIKSVSGIIATGKEMVEGPYACSKCDDSNCVYKRKPG